MNQPALFDTSDSDRQALEGIERNRLALEANVQVLEEIDRNSPRFHFRTPDGLPLCGEVGFRLLLVHLKETDSRPCPICREATLNLARGWDTNHKET